MPRFQRFVRRLAGGKRSGLPSARGNGASVAILADVLKARLGQIVGQFCRGIGPFLVDLLLPPPEGSLPAEHIHAVGADLPAGVVVCAPDAVGVLGLVQEHAPVQPFQVSRGVDVEHEQAAGLQKQPDPLEGFPQLVRPGHMVHAVQQAHTGVHRAVQVQVLHGLAEEDGRLPLPFQGLFRRNGQHLRGKIHPDQLIAPPGQQKGHGPRAAGQVQHRVDRVGGPGKEFFQKIRPGRVVHVLGHGVVTAGQRVVGLVPMAHGFFFSSQMASSRGRMV